MAAVERISEAYLLPVIGLLLEGFPFAIRGFHSDCGSEYVNQVEFTKSWPRQTNDNALAECKNGAIIRKLMGYSYIPQKHAAAINRFYAEALNPYLNFHRPCYFAVDKITVSILCPASTRMRGVTMTTALVAITIRASRDTI